MKQKDNVKFQHPLYEQYSTQVSVVRNIFDGTDTAKQYLVQAPKESTESYNKRKSMVTLKNYVKRATEAFVGMIFRKPADVTGYGEETVRILKKIDKTGSFDRFAREVTTILVRDGKTFVSVDTPVDGGDAYAKIFNRNQVINWRKNPDGTYAMMVVVESVEVQTGEFASEYVNQYRVYREDGSVTIYRDSEKDDSVYIYAEIQTDFDYIPIVELNLEELPPLYDIALLNIAHMNRTSLKNKYLDMSAIPIPIIWGASEDDPDSGEQPAYIIGVENAFVFTGSKEECDFQWRELSGSSIDQLQRDLGVIESDITTGVISAVKEEVNRTKTATQAYYEASESSNRVTVIANVVESGLNEIVNMIADMMNDKPLDTARVIINKDFNALIQNNDDIRLLFEVYMSGAVSIETFLSSLQKYEIIDIGSVEDELERIDNDSFKPKPKEISKEMKASTDNQMLSNMASD